MEVVTGILAMIAVVALCIVGMRVYARTAKLDAERNRKQILLYETLIRKLDEISCFEIHED